MSSFITTMSVPATPLTASSPPSGQNASKLQSHTVPAISPSHYQTTRTSHLPLLEPPSYLSPAVRALKQGCFGLTPPSNARTRAPFKPRSAAKGTSSYQLRQFAEATLGSGSLRKAVKLPEGEDLNEWLAVNSKTNFAWLTRDIFTNTSLSSCRLLQPDQPALWLNNRVLLPTDMP